MGEARAEAGGAEYVTDVAYLRNFVDDLAPSRLRLVAALNGFTPPPAEGFDYGELGAGNGDTIATLAAACPGSRFVGVDVNPDHAAFARGLASRGGLSNLRFLEDDFEALLDRKDLPSFDYLGAHGVMSWVGPAKRKALIDFAAAKLKPGGLLTVSYNALPGWAAVEPLRRLMLDASAGVTGSTLDRARHGIAAARALSDAGAEYFTSNPAARSMLNTMARAGLPYVAHEYFHAHWSPMYFADVAREMAEAGLYFVGCLPLYLNYKDLSVPPAAQRLFAGIESRVVLESMRDYATNEFFRRDVYVRGVVPCTPAATRAYFESTAFGAPGGIRRDVRLPHYTLQFVGPIFDALIPALTGASSTAAELSARPDLASFGAAKVRDALVRLALGDQILPMSRSTARAKAPGPGPYRVSSAYNRMILEQPLSSRSLVALASPVSATGTVLSTLDAVCLRVVASVEPVARPAWIRAFVAEQPIKIFDGDRPVEERGEQERVLSRKLDEFSAKKLPELLALGVVEA